MQEQSNTACPEKEVSILASSMSEPFNRSDIVVKCTTMNFLVPQYTSNKKEKFVTYTRKRRKKLDISVILEDPCDANITMTDVKSYNAIIDKNVNLLSKS